MQVLWSFMDEVWKASGDCHGEQRLVLGYGKRAKEASLWRTKKISVRGYGECAQCSGTARRPHLSVIVTPDFSLSS